eukprot:359059-Chlamydomonas_euryale.AAC.2
MLLLGERKCCCWGKGNVVAGGKERARDGAGAGDSGSAACGQLFVSMTPGEGTREQVARQGERKEGSGLRRVGSTTGGEHDTRQGYQGASR